MQAVAQRIIEGIQLRTSSLNYNGIHLRVEGDASGFSTRVGGIQNFWRLHSEAMDAAGFRDNVPVYLATALPKIALGSSGAGGQEPLRPGHASALADLTFYAADITRQRVRRP